MLAFFGVIVVLIVLVPLTSRMILAVSTVSFLTGFVFFTVTIQEAVRMLLLLSFALAVIVAFPALTPFTTPFLLTEATFLLELFQVIFAEAAFGAFVTFRVFFVPV